MLLWSECACRVVLLSTFVCLFLSISLLEFAFYFSFLNSFLNPEQIECGIAMDCAIRIGIECEEEIS